MNPDKQISMREKINSYAKMALNSSLLKSGSTTLVMRVSGYLMILGATAIVTRSQTPEVAGSYFLAFSIITILSVFGRFGLDKATVRILGNLEQTSTLEDRYQHVTAAVQLCLLISTPLVVVTGMLAPVLDHVFTANPSIDEAMTIAFIAIPAMSLHWVLCGVARGFKQNAEAVFFEAVSFPLLTIISIAICKYFWPAPPIQALAWSLVTAAFGQLLLNAIRRRNLVSLFSRASRETYRKIFSLSRHMLLISSVFMLMSWTDILMLGRYGSSDDVAFYVSALRIAGAISFVPICMDPYMQMVIPRKYAAGDINALKSLSGRVTSLIVALSTPVFLTITLMAAWILGLFGDENVAATNTLILLAAGYFVAAITGPVGTLLTMTNHATTMQRIVLFAAALNFILNYLLVPRYGHFGAAMATAISYVMLNLCSAYFVRIKLGFFVHPRL